MSRARPLPITVFAAVFLLGALLTFVGGLQHLDDEARYLAALVPGITWSRDAVIVLLSARLSIALIPIALVWFLANPFARWMVAAIALARLIGVPAAARMGEAGGGVSPYWVASLVASLVGAALLFTPAARAYFTNRKAPHAARG